MTRDDICNEYFEWMYQIVCNDKYNRKTTYRKLLQFLHMTEFIFLLTKDRNREVDGRYLRFRFANERGYGDDVVFDALDDGRHCSVLEMMIALAIRCEEHIMENDEAGDRTGQWFWGMIVNLGLGSMTDRKFDKAYARKVVDAFLNREYEPDGRGGLFTVENCDKDMRDVEIWYQMCWYLSDIWDC